MRVLLVARDEADARQLSGLLLHQNALPLRLATATDLGAALRHLAEHAVDIILLDLALPCEGDRPPLGILTAQAPAVPVLAFSDRHGDQDARAALQGGADDCLLRAEMTPQLLRHAMRSALERRRLRHAAGRGDVAAVRPAGGCQAPLCPSAGPQPLIPHLAPLARMASVGRLAGGLAHEVNNLLCALSSQLQVLQLHENLDPDLAPTLEAMERWVRRAAGSVGSLLEYALRPPGTRSHVDLHAATSRMLTLLQGSARFRHLELSTDFSPTLPSVEVDEAAWEQVVFELAANAAEAIPTRGSLRVRARQRLGNSPSAPVGGIEVAFEDDGPGIAAAHVPRLFEAFFTTKPEGEHAGLGLTIVRSIILDHQGDIQIEPNQPSGTRLIIRLPAPDPQPDSAHRAHVPVTSLLPSAHP